MRKLILVVVIFISIILLTACGFEVDASSYRIRYVGEYNDTYYFWEHNLETKEKYISYLKDGSFTKLEEAIDYMAVGLIGNQIILSVDTYQLRNIESYKLLNLDTLEYSSINSTTIRGLYNISYFDEEVIIFDSLSSETIRLVVYSLIDEEVISDISFIPANYYSYKNVYYENNKLYVNLNFPSNKSDNYDYIYNLDSKEITFVDSLSGHIMTVGDESLLFFNSYSRCETEGLFVGIESIEEEHFLSSEYGSLHRYNGVIVMDQVYSNHVELFNDNFFSTNQIDIEIGCSSGMVISESELLCIKENIKGSLIKSSQIKLVIYDFISKEVIEESDWIDIGSQLDNIIN